MIICLGVWLAYPTKIDFSLDTVDRQYGASAQEEWPERTSEEQLATNTTEGTIFSSLYQVAESASGLARAQAAGSGESGIFASLYHVAKASVGQEETSVPQIQAPFPTDQLIRRVEGVDNMVALTFDDGPYPEKTDEYLAVLEKYNAHATFFLVGQRMQYYPELAQKIVQSGQEVSSHSWSHARLDKMGADSIRQDFELVNEQAQSILGKSLNLFRPPYGGSNSTLLEVAGQMGYYSITWDVDPQDWEGYSPENIVSNILQFAQPGSIILLHEGRQNTLDALPAIISGLRERGLEPVSVSVLMSQPNAQPQQPQS